MTDFTVFKDKVFSLRWFLSWLYILIGSFLLSAAFVLFITPYKIVPGGVYGIGIILHSLFPNIQVGTFGFMLDVPLLILAFWIFGNKFGARTIVAAVLVPIIMNTLTHFVGEDPETMLGGNINLTNDVLLACIIGGVIAGAGLGIILRTHATSGGTDIIAMIVHKYSRLSFARSMLIVDSCVVILGLIVFRDWRIPLYSLIAIYVISKTIDYVIDGGGSNKLLFILSDKHEMIRQLIIEDLDRSGTYIQSMGMYSMQEKKMIFVVINRTELSTMQDYIKKIDPAAFMVIANVHEIYGEGFKPFEQKEG